MTTNKDWSNLEKSFKNPDLLQTTAYRKWRKQEQQQVYSLLQSLIPELSAAQKQHASDVLAKWIARFSSVARKDQKNLS